jgi:hypothetical protein
MLLEIETLCDKNDLLISQLASQKTHGIPESFHLHFWKKKALKSNCEELRD